MLLFLFACINSMETHEDFSVVYSQSQCRAYKQCNRSLFDGEYETMQQCEEEVQKSFLEDNQDYEGCTYMKDKAQECINIINQSNCGELYTNATEIYETCGTEVWICS